jgi:hypothetical protein
MHKQKTEHIDLIPKCISFHVAVTCIPFFGFLEAGLRQVQDPVTASIGIAEAILDALELLLLPVHTGALLRVIENLCHVWKVLSDLRKGFEKLVPQVLPGAL